MLRLRRKTEFPYTVRLLYNELCCHRAQARVSPVVLTQSELEVDVERRAFRPRDEREKSLGLLRVDVAPESRCLERDFAPMSADMSKSDPCRTCCRPGPVVSGCAIAVSGVRHQDF